MDLGAHLPLADFGDGTPSIDGLRDYVRAARDLGYTTVSANDHLVWQRPWLDGPTALAAVVGDAGPMALATSIALPVVRHPVVVADKGFGFARCLGRTSHLFQAQDNLRKGKLRDRNCIGLGRAGEPYAPLPKGIADQMLD